MIILIVIPAILTLMAYTLLESNAAIVLLFIAQLVIIYSVIRDKHLTGIGAFLFMSFLFFGMRPLYVWIESDHYLLHDLFFVSSDKKNLNEGMMWGVAGMLMFQVGAHVAKNFHRDRWSERFRKAKLESKNFTIVGLQMITTLLFFQLVTLFVMLAISSAGTTLYESALGAYIYDFPAVMQAAHIFTLLLILERYLKDRDPTAFIYLILSSCMFLIFTYEMRNISNFRGFYITGLMAAGIAALARLKKQVNALWLIVPIALLLPAFRILGETRYVKGDDLSEVIAESEVKSEGESSFIGQYWDFYDGHGDINIFDTFVAANLSSPKSYPYLLSWLYVPVHLVPRAFWESKPKKGTLQDVDFMFGAPYSPGIAGFFLLDGGILWMLLCMMVLGYLVAYVDWTVLTMPRTYLRYSLYGIVVVNALGLSRYFLWQYFYSVLYALLPCLLLAYLVNRSVNTGKSNHRFSDSGKSRRLSMRGKIQKSAPL